MVEEAFHKYANIQYSRNVNQWKQKWVAGKQPKGVHQDVFEGLKIHWMLPDTQATSTTNSNNRLSDRKEKGIAVHNAGATSFLFREQQLIEQNGGEPVDHFFFMEDTHTNKKTSQIQDGVAAEDIGLVNSQKQVRLTRLSEDGSTASNPLTFDEINQIVIDVSFSTQFY
ncbi:unnamed protein product [Arabis nemorensis]|uniref:Uncharacterized protein n=1 Tax=Arabis nemorensis TaxID=586526 RepID=A0A565CFK8_9BRAS|nr:unnamed protein product [Arabis nemorensis]